MNKYFIQNAVMAALLSGTFMVPTAFAKGNPHAQTSSHQTVIQQTEQQTTEQEQQQTEGQTPAFGQNEDHRGIHSENDLHADSTPNSGPNVTTGSNLNPNKVNQAQHKQEVQALHAEIAKLHQIQQQERSVHKQLNAAIQSLFANLQSDIQSGNTTNLSSLSTGLTSLGSNLQQAVQDGNTANQDVNQAQVQAKSTTGIQNAIAQIQRVETLKLQKIAAMQKVIQEMNTLLSTDSTGNPSTSSPADNSSTDNSAATSSTGN
jgi:hypothetical protein